MTETTTEAPAYATIAGVGRYRARAGGIDAVQWDGTVSGATAVINWVINDGGTARYHDDPPALSVDTVDGTRLARPGWWVARFPAGTFQAVGTDAFARQYEADDPSDGGELAEFLRAEADRERLAAEHYRRTAEELEGENAALREHMGTLAEVEAAARRHERLAVAAEATALKFTLFRPGNGPAHTQALDVVPLEDLLRLLGPAEAGP